MKWTLPLFLCLLTCSCFSQDFEIYAFQTTDDLSLEAARTREFKALDGDEINFGFAPGDVWVKVVFSEEFLQSSGGQLFYSNNKLADSISVYFVTPDSTWAEYYGTQIEHYPNDFMNPFVVQVPAQLEALYIRYRSHTFIRDNYGLGSREEIKSARDRLHLFFGSVLGILLILGAYNLFLFVRIREIAHFYYGLFVLSIMLMFLYIEGFGNLVIWRSNFGINNYFETVFAALGVFGLCNYVREVLSIRKYSPVFAKVLRWTGWLGLMSIALNVLPDLRLASMSANVLPMVTVILASIAAVIALRKGDKYVRYFLIGWITFISAVVGRILNNLGVLDYQVSFDVANYLGVIVEAIVFTWVISKRLRDMRSDLERKSLQLQQVSLEIDRLNLELQESMKNEAPITTEVEIPTMRLSEHLLEPLTPREEEVLIQLRRGLTYQQIADELFISKNTVKTHVLKIYEKLDAKNRTDALNKAKAMNLA